jgi:hypothetical protein
MVQIGHSLAQIVQLGHHTRAFLPKQQAALYLAATHWNLA